jgi:hypothetical protein
MTYLLLSDNCRRGNCIPFAGKSYIFSLRGGYLSRLRVVRRANPNPDEHLDLMGVAGAPRDRLKR